MAREVTRPVVPAPQPGPEPDTAPVVVQHAGLKFVPDGTTIWADRGDGNGNLVYTGGQLLPEWVVAKLAAGAALVPGPQPGVLVLEKAGKR